METDKTLTAVWYATEHRAKSATRILAYEDVGTLRLEGNGFSFDGPKGQIAAGEMNDVTFGRQRIAWVTFAICFPIGFPFVYLSWYLLNMMFSVSLWVVVSFWLVLSALGLLIGTSFKWVGIEHTDGNGGMVRSYFADGSGHGWGGLFGGNRRLLTVITERVRI